MRRWLTMLALPLLALALKPGGCGGGDDEDPALNDIFALAEDAGEASGAADTATAIMSIPVLALTTAASVASAAAAVKAATNVGIFFRPAGCITATAAGNVVTYTFVGCSGPLGLAGINGKLVATFTAAGGIVDIQVKSSGLKLNSTAVEQSATASVRFSGSVRTLTWNGGYKGTTQRGKLPLEHTADYTITYDTASSCVEIDGSGSTTLGSRGLQTQTVGWKRCGGLWYCPSSGTLTVTGKSSGLSIILSYLGKRRASITVPDGRTWEYTMLWCIPS